MLLYKNWLPHGIGTVFLLGIGHGLVGDGVMLISSLRRGCEHSVSSTRNWVTNGIREHMLDPLYRTVWRRYVR